MNAFQNLFQVECTKRARAESQRILEATCRVGEARLGRLGRPGGDARAGEFPCCVRSFGPLTAVEPRIEMEIPWNSFFQKLTQRSNWERELESKTLWGEIEHENLIEQW